jgi:hypothetical protein
MVLRLRQCLPLEQDSLSTLHKGAPPRKELSRLLTASTSHIRAFPLHRIGAEYVVRKDHHNDLLIVTLNWDIFKSSVHFHDPRLTRISSSQPEYQYGFT